MQLTEAATLDRKSGGADLSRRAVEGSAVPRTFPGNVFDRAKGNLHLQAPLTKNLNPGTADRRGVRRCSPGLGLERTVPPQFR
jgi:hypothetical protein